MSENETSLIGSEDKTKPNMDVKNTENNINLFYKMIQICRNNNVIPLKYVEDMIKMHKKCNIEKQNSKYLCKLIVEAIEYIPGNKKAFQYVANLYNEFLRLSKKDMTNLQVENCVASTSNGSVNMSLELDNERNSFEISESTKIFNELIEKCYANSKFPKSSIEVIDKLYRSLPSEFIDTKHFLQLLNESNQAIWPDSSASMYVYVEHVYNQLQQFETSMKAQDRKILDENNEANIKKHKTLRKLQKALKTARKQIKYLEEKEMDINSEEEFDVNSPYILKDKYEKRVIEIYKKICRITNEPDFLEESELRFNETNNKLVNKAIQKYFNLNKTFPDYYEIYTLLKLLQEKKKLNWTESELKNISQDAFLKLGKKLKLKRLNEYFGRLSYVTTVPDPAENDLELKKKLDESNRKLHADLNAVTEKYNNMQDYAEETDGSSLNNTDCENSSDDSCSNNRSSSNNKFKSTNCIPIKRKKLLSNKTEENEPPKKSQKTIYMESFNLTPCSVTLEPLNDSVNDEINVVAGKVQSKKTSDKSKKVNINIATEDSKNNDNLGSDNSAAEEYFADTDGDGTLVIDEGIEVNNDRNEIIPRNSQENETQKVGHDEQTMDISTISIDSEDYNPIIAEPEVIIHESEGVKKDVIEINELDDSDVEITSCDTPKVPVQNKKTLESIIKSMNFDKKYNWNQKSPCQKPSSSRPSGQKPPSQRPPSQRPSSQRPPSQRPPSLRPSNQRPILWPLQRHANPIPSSHGLHRQQSYNHDQNTSNHNLVNCWIMHNQQPHRSNQQPPRSNNNNRFRPPFNNRLSSANQRMQSTVHRNTTERQVTQRFSNSIQQQNNFLNNQSIIQQRVTTMTTTTMVRQIVQQPAESSGHRQLNNTNQNTRPVSVQSNTNGNPELIELD